MFAHVARPLRLLRNGAKIAFSSSGQVRAFARGLIGWSQDRLVETSGVPQRTLLRFELGQGEPQRRTVAAIRSALEAAGASSSSRRMAEAERMSVEEDHRMIVAEWTTARSL